MKTRRIVVNERCNQGCRFCTTRRAKERRLVYGQAAAAAAGTRSAEVILTGGEPTLRPDLPALVHEAAASGASVILHTNAVLIDDVMARALRAAGLSLARVHVPGWGARYESNTRDPGSFSAMKRGVMALQQAKIRLRAAIPLVRGVVAELADLPAHLSSWAERADLVTVLDGPSASEILSATELAGAVAVFHRAAKKHALTVRLDPANMPPPCLFARPARVAALYSLTAGGVSRSGFERRDGCEGCDVIDRCPGFPALLVGQPRPIRSENTRRRLSLIEDEAHQRERELVQQDVYRDRAGQAHPATIVRVQFACNQRCDFCFVSTQLANPDQEWVKKAVEQAAQRGDIVVLSGGEPTLSSFLLDVVRVAREKGAPHVDLQTNATQIDFPRAKALAAAGVDWAFVSLHAPDAERSDAITHAAGTFAKTCRGIKALIQAGVFVRLNFVITRENLSWLVEHTAFVAKTFPQALLVLSVVAVSTDVVPQHVVPRYSDVLPFLERALALAKQKGLEVAGLESLCGLPLCLVPEIVYEHLADVPPELAGEEMLYPPACDVCILRDRCFGVRRGYVALYGADELRPLRASLPKDTHQP